MTLPNYTSMIIKKNEMEWASVKFSTVLVCISTVIMVLMLTLPETVNNESDFEYVKTKRIVLTISIFIIFFIVCYFLIQNTKNNSDIFNENNSYHRFIKLFGPIILTLYCFKFSLFTYFLEKQNGKIIEGVEHNNLMTGLTLACISMFLFGFLDNFGMMAGLGAFDGYFNNKSSSEDSEEPSMYGNTFSDLLGAFLGMGVTGMLRYATFYNPKLGQPKLLVSDTGSLTAEAFSIFAGCLLPIFLSRFIYGKNNWNSGILFIGGIVALLAVIGTTGGISKYSAPSQLMWNITDVEPSKGKELTYQNGYGPLIEELESGKLEFTQDEWDNLNVGVVKKHDYVIVDYLIPPSDDMSSLPSSSSEPRIKYIQPKHSPDNFDTATATPLLIAGLFLLLVLMLIYIVLVGSDKFGSEVLKPSG